MMDATKLNQLVDRAKDGDRAAVSALVREVQDDVYRLAMRMLGGPDAEDATQEILVKVITHLGTFRGESAFRTWVFRIAANHLMNMQRGQREVFSFDMVEAMNAQMLAGGAIALPDGVDERMLAEEVRLGCTQAGVLCLDREHRLAFILGELFELPGEIAAAVLDVEPAAYRKRLSRARERIIEWMQKNCGLASPERPCRCEKQAGPLVAAGLIDPKRLMHTTHPRRGPDRDWRPVLAEMDDMQARAFAVQRSHPDYVAPESLTQKIKAILDSGRYRSLS